MTKRVLVNEIEIVASRVADLIRSISDTSLEITNSKWTAGSLGAHLVVSQQLSKKILQGEKSLS